MTLNTLPAEPLPDLPMQQSPEFAVTETPFGDGYTQTAQDGFNARRDTVTLSWSSITTAEKTVIIDFLEAHAPATPFYFTGPDGTQRTYTCRDYGVVQISAAFYDVRAKLNQEHGQ